MAYKIFFTEDALSDLAVVLDYISADNPSAAEQLGTSLLNHVELLQSLPRIGVPIPGCDWTLKKIFGHRFTQMHADKNSFFIRVDRRLSVA